MKAASRLYLTLFFIVTTCLTYSQNASVNSIKLDPDKVKLFSKYLEFKHGLEPGGFESWVLNNPDLYIKEMWYQTESFYVKRNHLSEGITLNEGAIEISRFESHRKANEEAIVVLPGFKDVLVLLPANKLIYKPN